MEQAANTGVNAGLWGAVIVFGILLAIAVVGLLISTRRSEELASRNDQQGGSGYATRPNERMTQVRADEARPEGQMAR